ncbi:hypothetical protein FIU91_02945 [Roseivivax sp. THAF30]|nr:hypothetical protein FIU91_02945 [Roseivivax sp. THAF30]
MLGLDRLAQPADTGPMPVLRVLSLMLLVLLALPWGAYLHAAGSPAQVSAEMPYEDTAHGPIDAEARDARATRPCRTATLPGAPCLHVIVPRAASGHGAMPVVDTTPRPEKAGWPRQACICPAKDPPRLG